MIGHLKLGKGSTMTNTLLTPELRELLENKDYDSLRNFCSSVDPETVAEFLGALSPDELSKTLMIIEPHLRTEIYGHLDRNIQAGLAEVSKIKFPVLSSHL